jgi:hypothetical protein
VFLQQVHQNALIIPATVPMTQQEFKETKDEIIVMFFCNIGISREVASSISLCE